PGYCFSGVAFKTSLESADSAPEQLRSVAARRPATNRVDYEAVSETILPRIPNMFGANRTPLHAHGHPRWAGVRRSAIAADTR
ncbi:MAG: hypothetical protein WA970_14720, partial [Gammaproteobacteria bacterium]